MVIIIIIIIMLLCIIVGFSGQTRPQVMSQFWLLVTLVNSIEFVSASKQMNNWACTHNHTHSMNVFTAPTINYESASHCVEEGWPSTTSRHHIVLSAMCWRRLTMNYVLTSHCVINYVLTSHWVEVDWLISLSSILILNHNFSSNWF